MNPPLRINVGGDHIRAVRFSKAGVAFILLTMGLGIGALNSGNNLLYLIFAMLLGMLIINAVLSRSSLARLTVELRFPDHIYAGTAAALRLDIQNGKRRLSTYALSLVPGKGRHLPPGSGHFIFKLAPGGRETTIHPHIFETRGRQPLPRFTLMSSFPFGLIEKLIPVQPGCDITVLPHIDPTGPWTPLTPQHHGDYLADRRGLGVNPYGVRHYRYGDEIRHMHWPSVARIGAWIIKEFEEEKRERVVLHLITAAARPTDAAASARREATVSAAASVLVALIRSQREVGLLINGQPITSTGAGYIDLYLEALALFDDPRTPARPVHSPAGPHPSGGLILAFSELPREAMGPARYDRLVVEQGAPV